MSTVDKNQLEELLEKLSPSEIITSDTDMKLFGSKSLHTVCKTTLSNCQLTTIPTNWLNKLNTIIYQ